MTHFVRSVLVVVCLVTALGSPARGDSSIQRPDGVITLTADVPTDQHAWKYKATRWGMYDVKVDAVVTDPAQGPGTGEAAYDITVTVGDEKNPLTAPIPVMDKDAAIGLDLGRVYVAKAGEVQITARGRGARIHRVTLTPAPEGGPIRQADDGSILLHSRDATVHGVTLRYEPKPEKNTLGYWSNPADSASWTFTVTQPGTFTVELLHGCGKGHGGSIATVTLGSASLTFTVEETGPSWQSFIARQVGTLTIDTAGQHTLTLAAKSKAKAAVMDCRQIRLIPVPPVK
jgi:hypothetical protein